MCYWCSIGETMSSNRYEMLLARHTLGKWLVYQILTPSLQHPNHPSKMWGGGISVWKDTLDRKRPSCSTTNSVWLKWSRAVVQLPSYMRKYRLTNMTLLLKKTWTVTTIWCRHGWGLKCFESVDHSSCRFFLSMNTVITPTNRNRMTKTN